MEDNLKDEAVLVVESGRIIWETKALRRELVSFGKSKAFIQVKQVHKEFPWVEDKIIIFPREMLYELMKQELERS